MRRKMNGSRKVIALQVLFVLAIICQANATLTDVNIYGGDFLIDDGDDYGTVNVFNDANVSMTGGDAFYCNMFNSSTWYSYDGVMGVLDMNDTSIARLYADRTPTMYLYNDSQIHIYNGGLSNSALIYDNAQLHIYGYDLYYDETFSPNRVTGQWENGQDFEIYLRNIYSYDPDQVFLHEIPEPISVLLFAFGGLLLRRTYK